SLVAAVAVRARGAAVPAAGTVPLLLGTERHLHRPLLAALRPDWSGDGDLGAGGRVRAVASIATSAVCEGARARARAPSPRPPFSQPAAGPLPHLRHTLRAGSARARRPCAAAERAVRGRTPSADDGAKPPRTAPIPCGNDIARRTRAGDRRRGEDARAA